MDPVQITDKCALSLDQICAVCNSHIKFEATAIFCPKGHFTIHLKTGVYFRGNEIVPRGTPGGVSPHAEGEGKR
jgi:hypothetical protein